jgi:hypothetical protein
MRGFGRSLLAGAIATIAVAGCGSSGHVGGHLDVQGQTTPADAASISVSVIGRTVAVSPTQIGAGQMIFNVANTGSSAETLVANALGGKGRTTRIGTVPAGGSFQIKVELSPGRYRIGSPDSGETAIVSGHRSLKSARLTVGPPRSGGDNGLSQP